MAWTYLNNGLLIAGRVTINYCCYVFVGFVVLFVTMTMNSRNNNNDVKSAFQYLLAV